ncbi:MULTISPECIES: hypothetical protein [Rhizobium]|uniref:Uncharacterized protein n=2 Tax=Rhizobium TaxID=379 RepID=A0A6P1CJ67_RHITR|nr:MULTISPECIES: hypothetical protein [Rhizobium]MBB4245206.1 hypothetical protein [Rhizobium tropici]MBB5596612.1 hypothetical protein [Rhizobium tropici]MBB6489332.1 hypothetical protein [Rhizobium lusitanum]MBB6495563.1 hypothetical protein [Rhizobium tropici]NEV14784.1 hypothetical protein [Rhizobium tropici]
MFFEAPSDVVAAAVMRLSCGVLIFWRAWLGLGWTPLLRRPDDANIEDLLPFNFKSQPA